jgi:hypothetical protein
MKTEWPWPALKENPAVCADQVQPIRPARVRGFDAVVEAIDQGWKLDPQFSHAGVSNRKSLCLITGTGEEDFVTHVGLHRPDIGGVRFKDIDGVERNLVLVLLSKFIQGGNLPPEGRSRIAPEDQYHGLRTPE